jgi:kynurenine formamidase
MRNSDELRDLAAANHVRFLFEAAVTVAPARKCRCGRDAHLLAVPKGRGAASGQADALSWDTQLHHQPDPDRDGERHEGRGFEAAVGKAQDRAQRRLRRIAATGPSRVARGWLGCDGQGERAGDCIRCRCDSRSERVSDMLEIIDLSQEIFSGMPVLPVLPEVKITLYASHEQWDGISNSEVVSPAVNRLEMGEHTGTHVDALNHMARQYRGQSIDTMPLTMFYTAGICLDLSHKGLLDVIEPVDVEQALSRAALDLQPGDTVLLYTDHYRRAFGTDDWSRGPGISVETARWLGQRKIAAFGVETMSPGLVGPSNKEVHHICGELGFTHYENMINLYQLVDRGRFRFIGLPLKIRGGTGSPVRAIAVFED